MASFSISSWRISLLRLSIGSGTEFISSLSLEAASSTRSMALSGRNLFVMYLWLRFTAAISASSSIRTLWWFSYLSLRPLRMAMDSAGAGSSTVTIWNRLSNALSASKYFWYSSRVVEPTVLSSPLANAGLRMLDASIAPELFPAPTRVWISSMKRMIWPALSITSLTTPFSLSSNSP